jgi:predicted  nucleic acid-binding Zn-ribbon protein
MESAHFPAHNNSSCSIGSSTGDLHQIVMDNLNTQKNNIEINDESAENSTGENYLSSSLPSNWLHCVEPNTGNSYYYNVVTNTSQWENPLLTRFQAYTEVSNHSSEGRRVAAESKESYNTSSSDDSEEKELLLLKKKPLRSATARITAYSGGLSGRRRLLRSANSSTQQPQAQPGSAPLQAVKSARNHVNNVLRDKLLELITVEAQLKHKISAMKSERQHIKSHAAKLSPVSQLVMKALQRCSERLEFWLANQPEKLSEFDMKLQQSLAVEHSTCQHIVSQINQYLNYSENLIAQCKSFKIELQASLHSVESTIKIDKTSLELSRNVATVVSVQTQLAQQAAQSFPVLSNPPNFAVIYKLFERVTFLQNSINDFITLLSSNSKLYSEQMKLSGRESSLALRNCSTQAAAIRHSLQTEVQAIKHSRNLLESKETRLKQELHSLIQPLTVCQTTYEYRLKHGDPSYSQAILQGLQTELQQLQAAIAQLEKELNSVQHELARMSEAEEELKAEVAAEESRQNFYSNCLNVEQTYRSAQKESKAQAASKNASSNLATLRSRAQLVRDLAAAEERIRVRKMNSMRPKYAQQQQHKIYPSVRITDF